MQFLKPLLILPFFYHKSATMSQIDSCKISNSKLKPDQCSYVKTEITETTAPLQQPHKRDTIFWDTLYTRILLCIHLVLNCSVGGGGVGSDDFDEPLILAHSDSEKLMFCEFS